jgi:curved DNA-binding protein
MPAHDTRLTLEAARALLGLSRHAGSEEARIAFRAAAKLAHPDRPGGDAGQFRQIVAAYRMLQAAPALPAAATAQVSEAYVEISPLIALNGGEAEAVLTGGRRLRARIPAGARHGERLRIAGGFKVAVRIAADEAMQVRGSDLWITVQVADFLLGEGGRAVVETQLGPKTLWVSGKVAERRLVRLEGQGLPARGGHPQGDLFVRLASDAGAPESPARARLRAFAAAWAA